MMVVAAKLEMECVVLSAEHTLDEVAVAAVGSNDLVNSSAVKDDDDPPHQRSRLLDPDCQKSQWCLEEDY